MHSITAVITNHNYSRYLPRCIESALLYCDEILVYEDGSTDDSLEVLARYPVAITSREGASGGPVWGSNEGIKDATSTHLIFLDADNYLLAPPPITDADYTFAAIKIVNDDESEQAVWGYSDWPLAVRDCWRRFLADPTSMPFPWGGVWRTEFIRPLRWRTWETTGFAPDFRTALDWCMCGPTLAYSPTPFLAFRTHEFQMSALSERDAMQREAAQVATTIKGDM